MELAKAYVQIVPTTQGIKNNISNELNDEMTKAGKSSGISWGNAMTSVISGVVGVATTAVATASTAVAGLTKQAVENYAEYEQLLGGIETLFGGSTQMFGTASYNVLQNAIEAYKTAGLSANEYIETVTSFSASLLQSLGGDTEKAVGYADRAIVDMADNANKMGTSMESIQNAYQGFAKQNYTMLDNLKLGYGGTKEEMKRLLEDATALSGIEYDLDSFADITEAIHVVQTNLGITGTTAEEASSTITGSVASMKSAWSNLVTAMADDNSNIDRAIKDFVDSIAGEDGQGGVVGNLIPRIEKALNGVGELVTKLAPIIAEKIPPMITSTMPTLLKSVKSLVQAVADNLPSLIKAITEIMPDLMNTIVDAILVLLPVLVDCALELVETLADGIADSLPVLVPPVMEMILKIADTIVNHLDTILQCAFHIIDALIDGLIEASPMLLDQGAKLVTDFALSIVNQLWTTIDAGVRIIDSVIKGLENKLPDLWNVAKSLPEKICNKFKENDYKLSNLGGSLAIDILNGFKSYFDNVLGNGNWVSNIVSNLINKIVSAFNLQISSIDWSSSVPSVNVSAANNIASAGAVASYYTPNTSSQNVNVTITQDKNATYKATVSSSYKTSKASGIPSSVLSKIG